MLACLGATAASAAPVERPPQHSTLDLRVLRSPEPAFIQGQRQLVYELLLTSFATGPLALSTLAVTDAQGATIASFSGDGLRAILGGPTPAADGQRPVLAPGASTVAYVTLPYPSGSPDRLLHRVEMEQPDAGGPRRFEAMGAAVEPSPSGAPLELGPPLAGGPWVAVYDHAWPRGHRRALYAVDGRVRVPGRFAIDWMKVDARGRYARGDEAAAGHWYGYGEEVLAVADATVATASDGMVEDPSVTGHAAARVPLADASGNYVSLDLGNVRYAFYEHLQPGSVRVRAGERVHRGQVIARLGYTGQSTGPHLHFHVADANDPLAADGVPYVITAYALLGRFDDAGDPGAGRTWKRAGDAPEARRKDMPAAMSVVEFGHR